MVKKDEKSLMVCLLDQTHLLGMERTAPRDIASDLGICYQRAYFIFRKWERQGYYEYGINPGLGWLTPEGIGRAYEYSLETK